MVSGCGCATVRRCRSIAARRVIWALLCGWAAVVSVGAGLAAAVTVTAEVDRKRVPVGQTVELTVTVKGAFTAAPTVAVPAIAGIEVYRGGTSQSFLFSDGVTEATVSTVYHLQVERETDFQIPALNVELAGQEYRTRPITVEVLPAGPAEDGDDEPPARQPSGAEPTVPSPAGRSGGGDEVFITTDVDRRTVYVGEQVVLSFKYYRRITPWESPTYKAPHTEGFWREDLPPERHYRARVRNVTYQVTEIRYALFPTRAGALTVGPAELSFPDDPFGRFFSRRRQAGPRQLQTEPITIQVRPLPTPRPPAFTGVVASQVELTAAIDRDTVPRGEAVGLSVTLRADGFLKSVDDLLVATPASIRMHDAAENLEVDVSGERLRSSLEIEKVLVPTQAGDFALPAVVVSYFDPGTGRYQNVRAEPGVLTVTPSDLPVAGDEASGFLRSEVARLGRDLAFVHPVSGELGRRWRPLPELWSWRLAILLPLAALLLWRQLLVRKEATLRDPVGYRRRQALTRAKRSIVHATRTEDPVVAHAEIARAIAGYVADRVNRPPAGITATQVERYAAGLGRADIGRRLAEIIDRCDRARFGSGVEAGGAVATLPAEVKRLLADLDATAARGRRARSDPDGDRRSGSVAGLVLLAVCFAAGAGIAQAPSELSNAAVPDPGIDPARLVAEGNAAYTDGDVAQARELYLRARRLGVNDPVVHYNLGNAYAREGHLGQAIASYLRARRLAPRDRDIATNLRWVRTHIADLTLGTTSLPPVIAQLLAAIAYLSLDEWSVVLAVLIWLVAALLGYGWYRGAGETWRRLLLGASGMLALVAVVVVWRWYDERVRDTAVVVAPEVEVRSGPAATFPVVFKIHDGLTVNRSGAREEWARITLGGDWVGWVPADQIESVRLNPSR